MATSKKSDTEILRDAIERHTDAVVTLLDRIHEEIRTLNFSVLSLANSAKTWKGVVIPAVLQEDNDVNLSGK